MKVFITPSWIPKLKEANIPFNLSPPTYQEITRIIKRVKSSGSPYPLDQISIICFKRYPYLRSSKVSWHLIVTKISNTWIKKNIDNIVSRYIRLWLEIPVNGTLNIVTQSKRKSGQGVILPSTRHTPCQVTFRNKLRKSDNHNIREIHKSTRNIYIQHDQFNSTREALKLIRSSDVSCIMEKLTTQSLAVKSIWESVDGRFTNQWSNVISHLPRNIFSFTIRYLNNTLANGTNAIKWGYNQQLHLHILWSTTNPWSCHWWMRNCIVRVKLQLASWLNSTEYLYKTIKSQGLQAFVDIEGYPNPSIVTSDEQRPNFALVKSDNYY